MKRKRLVCWIGLFEAGLAITILFSVGTLFGAYHHDLDLFTHFKLQYFAASLVLLVVFALAKRKIAASLSVLLIILNGYFVVPWWFGASDTNPGTLKLVHANVLLSNTETQRFIDFVREEDPDVLVVQELTTTWMLALRELQRDYPYSQTEPAMDPFGLGFYSKLPIETIDVIAAEPRGYVEFYVTLIAGVERLNVAISHPTPPIGQANHEARNTQLSNLGEAVSLLEKPSVLIGDFNVTMWSHAYRELVDRTRLRDARQGFGIEPTWPLFLPIAMIPIDHAFVSDDIVVRNFRTGPRIGSDHLPIIVEIEL